ncbi:(deoxy)nucleoside triphosphate pyrophosphohydrolase [Thioalkalivibrio paradoxus]|uniref:(deoxy)nucleoside triphosphate pyrophosphohydrolase n=1 Tax=Thioalkalivibrio paradoxus TaxID=108010 RepID=UPI00022C5674|nr:(deoxy)nucleoside triphosphate pyrophosphohydrolase [Thioalkalivibrio paradoxus]
MADEKLGHGDIPIKQVVCAVVRDSAGRVLMARRAPKQHLEGLWELPGGKVEPGESLARALQRELAEELGLNAGVGEEIARTIYHYDRGSIELIALSTEISNKVSRLVVHDTVAWFQSTETALLRIAPADIPLLEKIFDFKPA